MNLLPDRMADPGEMLLSMLIVLVFAAPVAVATQNTYAAAAVGIAGAFAVNRAYWWYRERRGDVIVEEHGTPYDPIDDEE